jgi:hypothetical protein
VKLLPAKVQYHTFSVFGVDPWSSQISGIEVLYQIGVSVLQPQCDGRTAYKAGWLEIGDPAMSF